MKKPTQPVKVVLSMPGFRVEGLISVPEGQRPSDYLNDQDKLFIAITDAKIYDWKGEFLEEKDFIAINKERISMISEIE